MSYQKIDEKIDKRKEKMDNGTVETKEMSCLGQTTLRRSSSSPLFLNYLPSNLKCLNHVISSITVLLRDIPADHGVLHSLNVTSNGIEAMEIGNINSLYNENKTDNIFSIL